MSRQERCPKEGDPKVTVPALRAGTALRCSRASAAAELGRCAPSDSPRRTPRSPLRFSASPTGGMAKPPSWECCQLSENGFFPIARRCHLLISAVPPEGFPGAPDDPPSSAEALGAVGEDCLSKPASPACEFRSRQAHRAAQGSRRRRPGHGVCFSLVPFFCTSKRKELAVRRNPDRHKQNKGTRRRRNSL